MYTQKRTQMSRKRVDLIAESHRNCINNLKGCEFVNYFVVDILFPLCILRAVDTICKRFAFKYANLHGVQCTLIYLF